MIISYRISCLLCQSGSVIPHLPRPVWPVQYTEIIGRNVLLIHRQNHGHSAGYTEFDLTAWRWKRGETWQILLIELAYQSSGNSWAFVSGKFKRICHKVCCFGRIFDKINSNNWIKELLLWQNMSIETSHRITWDMKGSGRA